MKPNLNEMIIHNSNQLRIITQKVIDIRKQPTATNLPDLPVELAPLSECLIKSEFTLVVSGEVNRGKSTFINAIIGQDILPTYDKETTSQVFKIRNSKEEKFYIVFDDGTKIPIGKEQLEEFGTELSSSKSSLLQNRRILFIEVNVPILNLPSNVTIVDTPGIGSTFKSHTEIAKSFMQEADAIVYICSSKHPIVKVDIEFIKSTILPLKTSPNVLFVMAKADMADSEEALSTMVSRAESQLKENFANYPQIGKRVIPVDSLSLKASNESSDAETVNVLRSVSNYEEVNKAIHHLIDYQRFCWLVSTFNCVAQYYKKTNQFLEKQLADYELNDKQRNEHLSSINAQIANFEKEMGSIRQREVIDNISNILSSLRADLKTEFASEKSSILKKYYSTVDALPNNISSESLNSEAQDMFTDIVNDATTVWDTLCEQALLGIQETLNQYNKECQFVVENEYNIDSSTNDDFSVNIDVTMSERVDAMRGKYFTALFGTTVGMFAIGALSTVSTTAATIATSLAFGPAGIAVAGAAIVYGLFYGNKKAKEKAVNKAKVEIKLHLKDILNEIYDKLTAISLIQGKHESVLKSFEKSIQENATDSISQIYNKTLGELKSLRNEVQNSSNPQNRVKLVNQQTLIKLVAVDLKKISPEIKSLNELFKNTDK